jgi:quinol monooxygenase YgiN
MIGLMVRFTCKDPESAEGFDQLVAETVPLVRQHEPGTVVYAVHSVEGKPLERVFYELYRDHQEQEHTRRFLAERDQYLAAREADRLSLLTGKGTDG